MKKYKYMKIYIQFNTWRIYKGWGSGIVNIQIFGLKKCFDTKKSERYFKERSIKYQFIDLSMKALSKGEIQSVSAAVGLNNLINTKSKEYKTLNIENIRNSSVKEEILLNNAKLYRTPIVRNGKQATVGYEPDIWKEWKWYKNYYQTRTVMRN